MRRMRSEVLGSPVPSQVLCTRCRDGLGEGRRGPRRVFGDSMEGTSQNLDLLPATLKSLICSVFESLQWATWTTRANVCRAGQMRWFFTWEPVWGATHHLQCPA